MKLFGPIFAIFMNLFEQISDRAAVQTFLLHYLLEFYAFEHANWYQQLHYTFFLYLQTAQS